MQHDKDQLLATEAQNYMTSYEPSLRLSNDTTFTHDVQSGIFQTIVNWQYTRGGSASFNSLSLFNEYVRVIDVKHILQDVLCLSDCRFRKYVLTPLPFIQLTPEHITYSTRKFMLHITQHKLQFELPPAPYPFNTTVKVYQKDPVIKTADNYPHPCRCVQCLKKGMYNDYSPRPSLDTLVQAIEASESGTFQTHPACVSWYNTSEDTESNTQSSALQHSDWTPPPGSSTSSQSLATIKEEIRFKPYSDKVDRSSELDFANHFEQSVADASTARMNQTITDPFTPQQSPFASPPPIKPQNGKVGTLSWSPTLDQMNARAQNSYQ